MTSFFDNKITLKELIYILSIVGGAFAQYTSITDRVQQIVSDAKLENQIINSKMNVITLAVDDFKNDFKEHLKLCQPALYAIKPKEIKITSDDSN